jgi:NTP pyrophosphatase (non-canonical NTP hydrolase)
MRYEEEALRTLSPQYHGPYVNLHLDSHVNQNVLHGALGISTEAGEILDAVKKSIFYGKPFDLVNLQEEIGDCFWYLAILAKEAGMSFEDIMAQNIAKLKARYPEMFTEEKALNRNLVAERSVLEGSTKEETIHRCFIDEVGRMPLEGDQFDHQHLGLWTWHSGGWTIDQD